jgi:hypothetical protein
MYSRKRIETIRKMKCYFSQIQRKECTRDDFEPVNPSFYIIFNKESGQFEIER